MPGAWSRWKGAAVVRGPYAGGPHGIGPLAGSQPASARRGEGCQLFWTDREPEVMVRATRWAADGLRGTMTWTFADEAAVVTA